MKYPKIETLYKRDKKTFKVIPSQFRCPEFGLITHWLVTEKIDGTNVRIIRTADGELGILGRSDKAAWAPRDSPLKLKLDKMFSIEHLNQIFDPGVEVILYGEGYGAGIQKGGKYRKDPSFRLFDVKVGDWWLNWGNIEYIAGKLDIATVPVLSLKYGMFPICAAELEDIVSYSEVARQERLEIGMLEDAEGIVARTDPLLFTRYGTRVMWKLKFKDFEEGKR